MGQVRYVQQAAIQQQLAAGNVVLLTNVGVSAAGELLNCNAYDVRETASASLLCCDWQSCPRCGCIRLMGVVMLLQMEHREQQAVHMLPPTLAHPPNTHCRWPPTRQWNSRLTSCCA